MGELKALDFGSSKGEDAIYANERIATLQEALELCAGMEGTQVQLELKSPLEDDPDFCPGCWMQSAPPGSPTGSPLHLLPPLPAVAGKAADA